MAKTDAVDIFMQLANARQLRLEDLEADIASMIKNGFVVSDWRADPLLQAMQSKSPEELLTEAKKKQLVAVIVGAMDGDGDGRLAQSEVLAYYKIFHPRCTGWEEVDPEVAMAAGVSRRAAINIFMDLSKGKDVDDLELELAELKAEGMQVGFGGGAEASDEGDEGDKADPTTKQGGANLAGRNKGKREVENVVVLARKLELVASMVGGLDDDNDGHITSSEIMRYYKVFHSCSILGILSIYGNN